MRRNIICLIFLILFHVNIISSFDFSISSLFQFLQDNGAQGIFTSLTDDITNLAALEGLIQLPSNYVSKYANYNDSNPEDWKLLFQTTGLELDDSCFVTKDTFYLRSYDGSCNWMKVNQTTIGKKGTRMFRDYNQLSYADGISQPRVGPNARNVSNAFFKRRQRLTFDHTPVLIGFVEFFIHDIIYSKNSATELLTIPIPACDEAFDPECFGNKTIGVWRTELLPGTGTSIDNPRQNTNEASTWLDLSTVYGSDNVTASKLRSYQDGKLLAQIGADGREYLPFNTMGVEINTLPGQDPTSVFAGGDPRTNQDFFLLGIHTLLLREHNRLCDILVVQHPDWDEEKLYQAARHLLNMKYYVLLLQYASSYFTPEMDILSPPADGLGIFRIAHNVGFDQINMFHKYPWQYSFMPPDPATGQIFISSHEMSLGYRFHDFIVPNFTLINARYENTELIDIAANQFNAKKFLNTSMSDILRGMTIEGIPNFHSGVDESFRSAQFAPGVYFDLAMLSVVHERERGVPTFNQYFTEHNKHYAHNVLIRKTWADFTPDPELQQKLAEMYNSVDDVDLTVGIELDESLFPGTTIPESSLITSLIGILGVAATDRFGPGPVEFRCLLIDTPWDCKPSNVLEELIWESKPQPGFPNYRWYNSFWMNELKLLDAGTGNFDLFWQMVKDNTDIQCLPSNSFFPLDEETNPMVCSYLPSSLLSSILFNPLEAASAAAALIAIGSTVGSVMGILVGCCCGMCLFTHCHGCEDRWRKFITWLGCPANKKVKPTSDDVDMVNTGGKTM